MILRVLSSLFAAALVLPSATAGVLIVDIAGGPGSQFTQLQPAIDAAATGDTIVIRPGTYNPSTIVGKGLSLSNDALLTGDVILGPIGVFATSAQQEVILRGLTISAIAGFSLPTQTMTISNCAGHVILEDCDIPDGNPALRVFSSPNVIVTSCRVTGMDQFISFFFVIPSGRALEAVSSSVVVYDSMLSGGQGGQGAQGPAFDEFQPSGPGGDAVALTNSQLRIIASSATGGSGGNGFVGTTTGCNPPGAGGAGITLDASSFVIRQDSDIFANVEGVAAGGCPTPGVITPPIDGPLANVTTLPYNDRHYTVSSPVRGGQSAVLQFKGFGGETPVLLISPIASLTPIPNPPGVFLPSVTGIIAPLISIPSTNTLTLAIPIPLLPASIDAAVLHTQAIFTSFVGAISVAEPSTLILLNQAF